MVYGNPCANPADPDDLRGCCRGPRRFIGWPTFFNFGDDDVRPSKKIDTLLSSPLFTLPPRVVAKAMHINVIDAAAMPALKALKLDTATPLCYYILNESELKTGGEHLGPVGGRIVAKVLIGLLQGRQAALPDARP